MVLRIAALAALALAGCDSLQPEVVPAYGELRWPEDTESGGRSEVRFRGSDSTFWNLYVSLAYIHDPQGDRWLNYPASAVLLKASPAGPVKVSVQPYGAPHGERAQCLVAHRTGTTGRRTPYRCETYSLGLDRLGDFRPCWQPFTCNIRRYSMGCSFIRRYANSERLHVQLEGWVSKGGEYSHSLYSSVKSLANPCHVE